MSIDTVEHLYAYCPVCGSTLTKGDLIDFDNNCYMCWSDLSSEKLEYYPYMGEDPDKDDLIDEISEDHRVICCNKDPMDCDCPRSEQGPTFGEALDAFMDLLPNHLYDEGSVAPCIGCVYQWSGMCQPLRSLLLSIHNWLNIHENADNMYIGSIDGCNKFSKMSSHSDNIEQQVHFVRLNTKAKKPDYSDI